MSAQPDIPTPDTPAVAQRSPEATLAWKMCQVMSKIKRIEKAGQNTEQKWHYATIDDIADAIREAMAEVGLAVFARMVNHSESKDGRVTMATATVEFKVVCTDTGAFEVMTWTGMAGDYSDKALNKAATYAEKFWLKSTFLVSTGDDPDDESPTGEKRDDKKATQQRQQPGSQQKPAQSQQPPTQPTTTQPTLVMKREDIGALVSRARAAKYIEPTQGEKDLLKLIGKPNWNGYTLATAGNAIKEAVEKLKATASVPVDKTVIVETARYNGKLISFPLPDGKWIPFFKGRTELSKLTGAEFAEEWHIADWTGTQAKPETYEFGPLEVTYRDDKGKLAFVTAAPVSLDDDLPMPDMTDEEIDAALAAAEAAADPNDIDAFFSDAGSPIPQHA